MTTTKATILKTIGITSPTQWVTFTPETEPDLAYTVPLKITRMLCDQELVDVTRIDGKGGWRVPPEALTEWCGEDEGVDLETLDWYRDGDQWVAMSTSLDGYVEIGVGDTREKAAANLEGTPIACTGRDYRLRALRWAHSTVEWISDTIQDADDGEAILLRG